MDKQSIARQVIPGGIRRNLKDLMGISALQERTARLESAVETSRQEIDFLKEIIYEIEGEVKGLAFVRGCFEGIQRQGNNLIIFGWMLHLKRQVDSFAFYTDGSKVGESFVNDREGVAKHFHFIPHAIRSGFKFAVPVPPDKERGMIDIRVVGISKGREVGKLETWYHKDMYSAPAPPPHLMSRQNDYQDASFHYTLGLQSYREFWTAICRHSDPSSIQRMLDWGCGCGRALWFFLRFSAIPRICGCDIDAEAITWCQENLAPAEFEAIAPYPPTSYSDNEFDLIISFSVLTHLSREVQLSWLEEMKRILAPGGLFLATVHGKLATRSSFPPNEAEEIIRNGIHDLAVGKFDGIAPEGYYRAIYQMKEYSLKEYSRYFLILEYLAGGALNHQDLIVMKKVQTAE